MRPERCDPADGSRVRVDAGAKLTRFEGLACATDMHALMGATDHGASRSARCWHCSRDGLIRRPSTRAHELRRSRNAFTQRKEGGQKACVEWAQRSLIGAVLEHRREAVGGLHLSLFDQPSSAGLCTCVRRRRPRGIGGRVSGGRWPASRRLVPFAFKWRALRPIRPTAATASALFLVPRKWRFRPP